MKKPPITGTLILLSLTLLLITSCTKKQSETSGASPVHPNTQVSDTIDANSQIEHGTTLSISSDYPVAPTIKEMAEGAHYIVTGQYTGLNSIWNMARNPNNTAQEDETNYIEGHIYDFAVDRVVKGDLTQDKIRINLKYSQIIKYKDASFTLQEPRFIEPVEGAVYMLFLDYDGEFDNFYHAMEPASIKFDDDNKAALESVLVGSTDIVETNVEVDNKGILEIEQTIARIEDTVSGLSFDEIMVRVQEVIGG